MAVNRPSDYPDLTIQKTRPQSRPATTMMRIPLDVSPMYRDITWSKEFHWSCACRGENVRGYRA